MYFEMRLTVFALTSQKLSYGVVPASLFVNKKSVLDEGGKKERKKERKNT